MRTNARSLPAAAALLLAACAAALGGCAKPETSPPPVAKNPCDRPGITVTVWVTYDGSAPKARTVNKTIYLCEEKDAVEWVSGDGFVSEDIQWKPNSPFDEPPKHDKDKKVLKSKAPKKGTAGHGFDYDAWLVLKDGTKKEIDPRIEIMP